MSQERLTEYTKRWGALKTERSTFIDHWRSINDYVKPRAARFLMSDANRGNRQNLKIINPSATLAHRNAVAGMMSGITNPARPWFRLTLPDPEIGDFGPVKRWLHTVQSRIHEVFLRSNIYNALPVMYSDLLMFGTHAMAVMEDFEDVLRAYTFPVGSYCLSGSSRLAVDTFYREFRMTVRQIMQSFERGNISTSVLHAARDGNLDRWVDVMHVIEPNDDYSEHKFEARFKAMRSVMFEVGANEGKLLSQSGFDEFPILAPRWEITGEDIYGTDCPGMTALGAVKALQLKETRKQQMIDKGTNPPLVAPVSLQKQKVSQLPGDVTYVAGQGTGQELKPLYAPDARWLQTLKEEIAECQQTISRCFFEDLFLMLSQSDRREITAREIEERHEEKLIALGPVLLRMNDEALDPLIDRTFSIMSRRGYIPEPPQEMQGMELRVEYISIMAQAMKLVGTKGLERFAAFVGNLAAVDATVLDKWDRDQSVEDYAEMTGINPKAIVSDEEVMRLRQERAQAAQAQQMVEQGSQLAQSAKVLSEADTNEGNALSSIINNAGVGAL